MTWWICGTSFEAAATAAISDKMAWICLDVPKAEEVIIPYHGFRQ